MAKNFPYFKFTVSEWMTGDIVFESLSTQGLFINICALYWQRDGNLSIYDINKRYRNPIELIDLINKFIEIENDKISIKFLDEQLIDANHVSKVNSENGKKSAEKRATAQRALNENPATAQRISTKKNKNKIKEEEEINIDDIKIYFLQNGYSENSAKKFYDYYSIANWKDSKGNQVKNWKQKAQAVWFKPENKIIDINTPLKMVY
jgi:NACalpha-BTF3-like transcription factor